MWGHNADAQDVNYIKKRVEYLQDKAVKFVADGDKVVYYTRRGKEAFRFDGGRMILPPKGNRPKAKEYLDRKYVRNHKKAFRKEGCAVVVVREWTVDNARFTNWPPRKFVGLASEMDKVVDDFHKAGNDVSLINERLSLGASPAELDSSHIYYVRIKPKDRRFRYGFPDGNEIGAIDSEWVPGGLTKNGVRECVLIHAERVNYKSDDMESFLHNFDNGGWVRLK